METGKRKRPAASRASRRSKKYWRKGADIGGAEEVLYQQNDDLSKKKDEELFTIDTTPSDEKPKPTKRQKAILERFGREAVELPSFPKKPTGDWKSIRPPREERKDRKTRALPGTNYDLWETDIAPKPKRMSESEEGAKWFMEQTKLARVAVPKTLKQKPSLRPAVSIPEPATSYNPKSNDYLSYVSKLAAEEALVEKKEEKEKRKTSLPEGVAYCTRAERNREEAEGLFDDGTAKEEAEEEEKDEEAVQIEKKPVVCERKTKKVRRKEKERKIREMRAERAKREKADANNVFRTKQMKKQLAKMEEERLAKMKGRVEKKLIDKAIGRKKLGRGKYEEPEKEFLLVSELPESLRQLNPQGSILSERLKSFQGRNMLPIGGDRMSRKKKTKLKVKIQERRAHKEVTLGSRVI